MRIITLFIITMLLVSSCVEEEVNTSNHSPVVKSFKVNPPIAQPGVKISFEADDIMDVEDTNENLQVCWSFLGDDNFTEYTSDKNAEYTYNAPGCYLPVLKVKDTKSLTSLKSMVVVIVNDTNNKPPDQPELMFPLDNAIIFGKDVTFFWECVADPENDPIIYDLWIGNTSYNLRKVNANINTGSINKTKVLIDKSSYYYWTISAKDSPNGNYTFSKIRKFKLTSE